MTNEHSAWVNLAAALERAGCELLKLSGQVQERQFNRLPLNPGHREDATRRIDQLRDTLAVIERQIARDNIAAKAALRESNAVDRLFARVEQIESAAHDADS